MKIADRFRKSRFFRIDQGDRKTSKDRSGIALLTVLTVMALTTIMVMTFFSLAMSENRASATYSHGLQAQQVAEEAVNMVIAQIRKATTVSASSGTPIAWASQPGMIRTWRGRNFDAGYKLYSDERMLITSQAQVDADFNDIRNGWSNRNEQFVDLNEPVIRGRKVYYPIVNPTASTIPNWPKAIGRDQNGVEGFRYNWDAGHSVTDPGRMGQKGAARLNVAHVPMPVRWIYQLADGTLGSLDNSNRFRAMDSGVMPSENNRIVARFAFWADDETSKLNLNTAAGGLAWDIPRAGGQLDMDMARFQPAQHEWQRYPGHPATTHLIPALAPGVLDIVNDRDAMEMLFRVVPRIVGGGSRSGTRIINNRDPAEENGLIADKDPLYPSLDDMVMRPDRTPNQFPDARGRPLPENQLSEYLERAKFFLTVTSKAPETNMFNKPRVAIWPIFDAAIGSRKYMTHLTAFDRLIHYCASMGGRQGARFDYIFKRRNADSQTEDYLGIPRNKELYAYLSGLMKERIPGYGESFRSKYPRDDEQILTEIFDYIRSTNLHDDSLFTDFSNAYTPVNTNNHLTYTNPRNSRNRAISHLGHGQVVPITIGTTKGFGRFNTITGASIVAMCVGEGPGSQLYPSYPGMGSYRGRYDVQAGGAVIGTNYPPIPLGIKINDPAIEQVEDRNTWPEWMKDPEITPPQELSLMTDRNNWNWQLAFLDPFYVSNVIGAPNSTKFNRAALSPPDIVNNNDPFSNFTTKLKNGEKLVQAALFFELFSPSIGWNQLATDMKIKIDVSNMRFGVSRGNPEFLRNRFDWISNTRLLTWGERTYGGGRSHLYTLGASKRTGPSIGRLSMIDRGYTNAEEWNKYNLVTMPFVINDNDTFSLLSNAKVIFELYSGEASAQRESAPQGVGGRLPVQTIEMIFRPFSVPAPALEPGIPGYIDELRREFPAHSLLGSLSLTNDPGNPQRAVRVGGRDMPVSPAGRFSRLSQPGPSAIRSLDVVRSVSLRHGDVRLVAARQTVFDSEGIFTPHYRYDNNSVRMAHSLTNAAGGAFPGMINDSTRKIVPRLDYGWRRPIEMTGDVSTQVQLYGDFDNGAGLMIDGPYINKPDEGNTNALKLKYDQAIQDQWERMRDYGEFPYFAREWRHESGGPAFFSPNRLVSGPGVFGSLPTGVNTNKPWQTLLFRPNVVGNGYSSHPGAGRQQGGVDPPDHVIMDLFWMPVVEPYAISEPLSTAGKINMNYAMQPFKHIERTTALRGVLRSEFIMCVPNRWTRDYKTGVGRGVGYHWRDSPYGGNLQGKRLRSVIVEDETLDQFRDEYFDKGDLFKSASQICEIHLIGEDVARRIGGSKGSQIGTYKPTLAQMKNGRYWKDHAVVGDNSKERPYTNIHQRLTTKSNTFKVHYRAQVLKQARRAAGGSYEIWNPTMDTMQAEYRGSSIVERYVDPNDPNVPDYARNPNAPPLDLFYKFRVVNPTRFAP